MNKKKYKEQKEKKISNDSNPKEVRDSMKNKELSKQKNEKTIYIS